MYTPSPLASYSLRSCCSAARSLGLSTARLPLVRFRSRIRVRVRVRVRPNPNP